MFRIGLRLLEQGAGEREPERGRRLALPQALGPGRRRLVPVAVRLGRLGARLGVRPLQRRGARGKALLQRPPVGIRIRPQARDREFGAAGRTWQQAGGQQQHTQEVGGIFHR